MARAELSWNDAIEKVLRDLGEPMNYMDITEAIIREGLRTKLGATPSYTVAAQFSMDKKKGSNSRFIWMSKATYGLREWAETTPPAESAVAAEVNPEAAVTELAIQAFGMYWDRDPVDWGKSAPKVLGQQFQNTDSVDFAGQRGIYVLYDDRVVVYIGRATQQTLGPRLRDHSFDRLRTRWNRFSWFGFSGVEASGNLLDAWSATAGLEGVISQLETVLIEIIEPPQNRQQGKGFSGIEYLQADDPAMAKKKHAELLALLASKLAPPED